MEARGGGSGGRKMGFWSPDDSEHDGSAVRLTETCLVVDLIADGCGVHSDSKKQL